MPNKLSTFNYPIETEEAVEFWNSEHRCNVAKAYMSFSKDLGNFNDLMKRAGYSYQWRKRAAANFGPYLKHPSMQGVPFSEFKTTYWNCMAHYEHIDLEWIITEITEETISTENCRPILTEDANTGPNGPELPLPVAAWLTTEITEETILTEDGDVIISENYTTSKNVGSDGSYIPPPWET